MTVIWERNKAALSWAATFVVVELGTVIQHLTHWGSP